ncbi:hypothetical protein [Pseudomonas sichuanensis]|uniref:DUF4760 domain-containing protein n=1 Tax=Pseudomonas sichuanensis TaxID=2213015 RepID=A0ABV0DCT2_9PSED
MDRVVLAGCILMVAFGALLGFCVGASENTVKGVREAMELLAFAATTVTGVVAVIALTSWRNQFQHTKRFETVNDLKNSAIKLNSYIEYVGAVVHKMQVFNFDFESPQELRDAEDSARQRWLEALDDYGRAWGAAAVFLSDAELASLSVPVSVLVNRTLEDPAKIMVAFQNAPKEKRHEVFIETVEEVMGTASEMCERARIEIEALLKKRSK